MKSERRHELQRNSLDEELSKAVIFLKRWGFHLAMGAVVIVVLCIFGLSRYKNYQVDQANSHFQIGQWHNQLADAKSLSEDEIPKDDLAKQDGLIGAHATYLQGRDALVLAATGTSDEEAAKNRQIAKDKFNKVIEKFGEFTQLKAQSHLGLAILAERGDDLTEAINQYQKIVEISSLNAYPVYILAGERKRQLESLVEDNDPIRFATVQTTRMQISSLVEKFLFDAGSLSGDNDPVLRESIIPAAEACKMVLEQTKSVRDLLINWGQRARFTINHANTNANKAMVITSPLTSSGETSRTGVIVVRLILNDQKRWLINEVDVKDESIAKQMFDNFMK